MGDRAVICIAQIAHELVHWVRAFAASSNPSCPAFALLDGPPTANALLDAASNLQRLASPWKQSVQPPELRVPPFHRRFPSSLRNCADDTSPNDSLDRGVAIHGVDCMSLTMENAG